MKVQEMITYVAHLVDDVPDTNDVISWLNTGQNIMSQTVQARFPQLLNTTQDPNLTGTFVFPEKYHHIPCLYAAAMYKAQDTSFQEEQMFIQQFKDQVDVFTAYYDPPQQYNDSPTSQQYTASAGDTTFAITKDTYDRKFGDLRVYVNGVRTLNFTLPQVNDPNPNTFTLNTPANSGDFISALWEEHFDLVDPPYNFWRW